MHVAIVGSTPDSKPTIASKASFFSPAIAPQRSPTGVANTHRRTGLIMPGGFFLLDIKNRQSVRLAEERIHRTGI